MTRRILDTYIPRRAELALAAIGTWEANPQVVALHTLPMQRSLEAAVERVVNERANRPANRGGSANRKLPVSALKDGADTRI